MITKEILANQTHSAKHAMDDTLKQIRDGATMLAEYATSLAQHAQNFLDDRTSFIQGVAHHAQQVEDLCIRFEEYRKIYQRLLMRLG